MLANTIPTAFWAIYHAFRDPKTLSDLRVEAEKLISAPDEQSPGKALSRVISISRLREVPRLVSHIQESLRHHGAGAGTRYVREDILLDKRYLLKKDTFIVMPNRSIHFDGKVWGPSVADFDSSRFDGSRTKVHPAAFRGFGGGSHLCPGRFFAMTEILTMLVTLILRFDLEPADGKWPELLGDESNMSLSVAPPTNDVLVRITKRGGWEERDWKLTL